MRKFTFAVTGILFCTSAVFGQRPVSSITVASYSVPAGAESFLTPGEPSPASTSSAPVAPVVSSSLEVNDPSPGPNEDLVLTAYVERTGQPASAGTVTFFDADYNHVVGTAAVRGGVARFKVNSSHFPNGRYSLIAIYHGTGAHTRAASAPVQVNVSNN